MTAPGAAPALASLEAGDAPPPREGGELIPDISEEHSSHFSLAGLAGALNSTAVVAMTQFGGHFQVDLSTVPRSGFPTAGANYVVVSSGDARNPSGISSASNSGCTFDSQWGSLCNVGGVDVSVAIPTTAHELSFDLKFFEWDYLPYEDPFRVYLIAPNGASTLVAQFYNSSEFTNKNFGGFAVGPSRTVTMSVAAYAGQTIKVRLQASDRSDNINNSGAFIDHFVFDGGVPPNGPPQVSIIGGPYSTDEGSGVVLTATATDPNGDALTYDWDFGDGSEHSTSLNAPHTYADNGNYTATLTVSDGKGGVTSASTSVTVANVAPSAFAGFAGQGADGESASVPSGGTITFVGSFTDPGTNDHDWSYVIDWGDGSAPTTGSSSSLANANIQHSHAFPSGLPHGTTYTVTLTVTDKDGQSGQDAFAVNITNSAPAIAFDAPGYAVAEGSPLTLGVTAVDAEGDAVSLAWTFIGPASASGVGGPNPTVRYDDNGSFSAIVVATDAVGNSSTASVGIFVSNVDPTATMTLDRSVLDEGETFHISLGDVVEPSSIDAASIEYAFDCGLGYGPSGSNPAASCLTNDDGLRSIRALVKDKDGGFTEYTASVTVKNVAPTAVFTAPSVVNEGGTFVIELTGATDPSSADAAAGFTYALDCGDGTSVSGTSPSLTCAAQDNALRNVSATITDKNGGSTPYSAVVEIRNVAPGVVAGSGATILSGQSFTLNGSFTDPGLLDYPWSFTIGWGDGTSTGGQASAQGAITRSHTYLRAGTYTAKLSVTDKDLETGADATQVIVQRVPVGGPAGYEVINVQGVGQGMVTIDVLSTSSVDATTIVVSTATLGNEVGAETGVERRNNGTYMTTIQDIDGDGRMDMSLKFRRDALRNTGDLDESTTHLVLLADLADGRQVRGVYNVRTVPR